ncbi:DNA polymerase III subunit alpha [Terrarubrum flagellatum]|uniref:DNA polymerase III subunit alpha n=1 Tax=Terrirubrum flagellatum TaxID=2895980 RepID=UPI003144FF5E
MARILEEIGFVHLHVHSAYSLLEGALKIDKLAKLAIADQMPALAITDSNNLFGALEFSEKLAKEGVQPIVGLQLSVAVAARDNVGHGLPRAHPSIVLLAATGEGYRNLMRLGSRAFLSPAPGEPPHAPWSMLADFSEGLICLTGGPSGPVDLALAEGNSSLARQRLDELASVFKDRLYVELQRHGRETERAVEPQLLDLAYRSGLPLVAANDVYFGSQEDYEAHDALIAIAEGRIVADDNRRRLTSSHDFKTRAQMQQLFADLPEATANSVEIAMRCLYRPSSLKTPMLPRFTPGAADAREAEEREAAEMRRVAEEGLSARLAAHGTAPGLTEEDYRNRLAFEIGVITKMKYQGYFLIVADFIRWAKNHGIPVGPGRGSGAGSLVAYSLTITDLDPLRFGLLFERFLNPDRVSMPDFDIDFCQDRRDEVIAYVQERYGQDRVAQIITFGSLLARGVMRDVGRVLEMPYGQVDKLTKLVPQNPANPVTLAQAIKDEARLREAADEDAVVDRMLTIAQKLEGLYRHASTHAAGIVIGDRPLDQIVPLYRDPKSDMPVTQFNMKWVEPAGLVKFDFLGLRTLTTLTTAVALLKQRDIELDLQALPLDDVKTYEMLGRGEVVGVFQVESAGMRRALVEMKASRFEDLIALVALYRPGPMANIPVYCARKLGYEQPEYPHAMLKPILEETFGIIVYQEQVMQAAQIMSGYSLGEADLLRRAMGKKIKAEMDAQRVRFVTGAVDNGVPQAKADEVFDLLAKFADYGFNKSHAAAYALIAFQTAYLKANYPVEFMAASMTLDIGNTDKLAEFRLEAKRLGIPVEPPSVNRSGVVFDVRGGSIFYALGAIKGVGRQAAEHIVDARGDRPFTSLADFASRISARIVNKRTLEALVAAGAFDALESDRARAFATVDLIVGLANRETAAAESGQGDMLGGGGNATLPIPKTTMWTPQEKLQREHQAVGFYLSGHPLDDYGPILKRQNIQTYAQFAASVRQGATVGKLAASVLGKTERRTKTGGKLGIILLSDASGQYEATLFAERLNQYRDLLETGQIVLLTVSASADGDDIRVRIQSAEPLDQAAKSQAAIMRIFVRDQEPLPDLSRQLIQKGDGEVSIVALMTGGREVEVKLPGRYRAAPQVAGALRTIPGVVAVELA